MKMFILIPIFILISGCSFWPKITVLGDDYYISPFSPDTPIVSPPKTGNSGSAEGSNSMQASENQ